MHTVVFFVLKLNLFYLNSINLNSNSNPTVNYADLVVQPNTFNYGLYRFVYRVVMLNTRNAQFQEEVDTFIRIVPSGLVVSSIAGSQTTGGGTYEITRGSKQAIVLNPVLYSFDLDGVKAISGLEFKFYCQVIEYGVEMGYPLAAVDAKIDLSMFKSNAYNMSDVKTCFDSGGRLFLTRFEYKLKCRITEFNLWV